MFLFVKDWNFIKMTFCQKFSHFMIKLLSYRMKDINKIIQTHPLKLSFSICAWWLCLHGEGPGWAAWQWVGANEKALQEEGDASQTENEGLGDHELKNEEEAITGDAA